MGQVIILGGGLAGTHAALLLADRGHRTVLVEARDRLGGRAFSADWRGEVTEFGGGWLNESHPRSLALARRLGLGLVPRPALTARRYLRDGTLYDAPWDGGERAGFEAAMAAWAASLSDPDQLEMTLADWFAAHDISAPARREILAWWAISGSGDPAGIAVGELLTAKTAGGFGPKLEELAYTIAGGVQALAEGAARLSGAEVRLNSRAALLREHGEGVEVTLHTGEVLSADAALVALPVNALAGLAFNPPLAGYAARLREKGHLGRAVKVLARLRGAAPGVLVTGEAGGLRWFWSDHACADGSTLVVAFGLERDIADPSAPGLASALQAAFPGSTVEAVQGHDWCADPFALGTWVAPRAGLEPAHDPFAWPGHGRVGFATSDLAPEAAGWFEGALAAAELAVRRMAPVLVPERTGQT